MKSSERSIGLWSSWKDIFSGNPNSSGARWQSADVANLVHAVEAASLRRCIRFKGAQSLLDVGAGGGRWTREFAGDVKQVTAIEPSKIYDILVASVAEYDNVRCLKTSFEAFEEAERFDFIVISGVFFYIIEDAEVEKMIAKIRRLLKPDGIAILRESVSSRGLTVIDWKKFPPDTIINTETCEYWEKLRPESFYLESCRHVGLKLLNTFPTHAPFFQYLPTNNSLAIRFARWCAARFFTMSNLGMVSLYNVLFRTPYALIQNALNLKAFRFYVFGNIKGQA